MRKSPLLSLVLIALLSACSPQGEPAESEAIEPAICDTYRQQMKRVLPTSMGGDGPDLAPAGESFSGSLQALVERLRSVKPPRGLAEPHSDLVRSFELTVESFNLVFQDPAKAEEIQEEADALLRQADQGFATMGCDIGFTD